MSVFQVTSECLYALSPMGEKEKDALQLFFVTMTAKGSVKLRIVWWDGLGLIEDIVEQDVWTHIPDDATDRDVAAFWAAWEDVVRDVLLAKPRILLVSDLFPAGNKSVWKLKGRSQVEFEKALRAKSRLGRWLKEE